MKTLSTHPIFGLKHALYDTGGKKDYMFDDDTPQGAEELARPGFVYTIPYQYKFGAKEWQDELGLGLYDYGWRNYDAALGRWMNIDPLADAYPHTSPYNYVLNNPLVYIDPDGRKVIVGNEEDRAQVLGFLSNIYGENNFEFNDNNELKFIGNKKDFKGDAKETLGVLSDLIDADYDINVQLSGFSDEQIANLDKYSRAYTVIMENGANIYLDENKLKDIPLFGSKIYMYLDSNGILQSKKNYKRFLPMLILRWIILLFMIKVVK